MIEHPAVMPDEVVQLMSPLPHGARICDATVGGGGHSARLLGLDDSAVLVAIDADQSMLGRAQARLAAIPDSGKRISWHHGWFDELIPTLGKFDRILLDLGVSMIHLKEGARGFSLREDGPLDMRLNREGGARSAAELLAHIGEGELADVIFQYGEERYSRRIARAIVERRRNEPITGTAELARIVWDSVPPPYRRGRMHPATRTFQALRIAVNDELGRIERVLPTAAAALRPAGRLVVISFHSLEDRIVKHRFRSIAGVNQPMVKEEGSAQFGILTKKPLTPTDEEIARNSAARSAKLRALERIGEG